MRAEQHVTGKGLQTATLLKAGTVIHSPQALAGHDLMRLPIRALLGAD